MESKQGRNGLPGNTQRGGYYNTFYRIHYNYTIVFCYGVLCWTRQYTGPEHPLHYVTKTKNHYVEPSNTQEGSLQYLSILATEYCSMVYIVLCCSRQFTGGAATTIPTNHYVVLLCTRQYRKHCNTLQYSLQNTLLWCTLYYVVPGNSRTGGAATTIPHNSGVYCGVLWSTSMMYYVVLRCNMERYCYVLCCTMVNCGVLWSTTMMYYGVLSSCTTLYEVIPRRGWG